MYAAKWFKTTATNSVQTDPRSRRTFEGNGYVNVSFVRGLDSREIFMSPLSYGVMPFSVSRERRTVKIDIDTPELARPGEPFRIRYKGNKAGKAVVFAVDEGILQVARYKTPDPLDISSEETSARGEHVPDPGPDHARGFNGAHALGSGRGRRRGRGLGKNLNPFKRKRDKPVVYWSGIVNIDTASRELVYQVPDYFNGTIPGHGSGGRSGRRRREPEEDHRSAAISCSAPMCRPLSRRVTNSR